VIAGAKSGAALVNLEKPWRAIRRAAALDDVRLHDLRHAFASIAASSGLGFADHRQNVRSRSTSYDGALRTPRERPGEVAAAVVANKIAAAMSGTRGSGETVVPLRSSAARP
jgi:integrase